MRRRDARRVSYSKLAVRGAFWSLLQVFAERSTQTVVMLTAALFLGPRDFGLAAMATAPAIIIASTLQTGSQFVVQRPEADQTFLDTAFSLFMVVGLAGALVIAAIAAGAFYALPDYPGIWLLILPTMIAPLCAAVGVVPEGVLTRNFAYRALAVRKTIGQALAGVLCCGMAAYGLGAWSIVVQVTLAPLITTAISLFLVQWRPTEIASIARIREASRFSAALLGISALNQINIRSVDVLVGLIAGPSATGVFRLARTVLDLATSLFLNPVNSVLLPIFSRMAADRERTLDAMWQACGITSLVASVPFVASSFGAPYAAELIFSNRWANLAETITVLLVSLPFIALIIPLQTYLVATGQAKVALYNNFYQTLANVIMISCGAYFGIIWAAAAFSLRCFLGGAVLIVFIKRMSPEIKIPAEAITSLPAVLGIAIVACLGAITSMVPLDLSRLLPTISMTSLALSLYAGFSLILFRARISKILAAIRAKS